MPAESDSLQGFEFTMAHDKLQGEFDLVRIEGTEGLGELFEFNVQFVDSDPDASLLNGRDAVGYECGLHWKFAMAEIAQGGEDIERDIHGLCTHFRPLGKLDELNHYELTLRPKMWLLTRQTHSRLFKQNKPSDVIQSILSDYGVQAAVDSLGSVVDHIVQYQETDFAFVSRLIERVGGTYAFEHSSGSHTVKVRDANGVIGETHSDIKHHPGISGVVGERYISGVSANSSLETNTVSVRDWDFDSAEVVTGDDALPREHGLPTHETKVFPSTMTGETAKTQGASDLATVLATVETARTERLMVTGYVPDLQPGDAFSIEENPAGSGDYIVLRAHHSVDIDLRYRSGGGGGGGYFGSYEAIPSTLKYPSPMSTPWPKISGPQTAVVVTGHESDPDNKGRIEVKFHWDEDGDNTYWARVAQLWADDDWGAFFFPRVGMEVVVEFLGGDPDRPIVTGAMYHGQHAVPEEGGQEVKSGWKDAATNILSFDDTSGSEKVYIHAQKDKEVLIENDETRTLVGGNRTTEIQQGNDDLTVGMGDMSVDVSLGQIDIKAAQKIKMTVGNMASLTIEPTKITLSAMQIEISADMQLDAKGMMTNVDGSAILKLTGGIIKVN